MGLIDFIEIAVEAGEYLSDRAKANAEKEARKKAAQKKAARERAAKKRAFEEAKEKEYESQDLEQNANSNSSKQGKKTQANNVSSNLYDATIEQLISCALIDGELSEKEKQVLLKRAEAQGIDLDEFEMVLNARLMELRKEKRTTSAPKSDKLGETRKCPNCGAVVQSYQGKCHECGYEFEGLEANISSKKLAENLHTINAKYNQLVHSARYDDEKIWDLNKNRANALAQAIKSFPMPITKADLLEFISTMQANMLNEETSQLESAAYMTKYREAVIKSKALWSNDPLFANFISEADKVMAEYTKISKKQISYSSNPHVIKRRLIISLSIIGFWCLALTATFVGSIDKKEVNPSKCLTKVERAVKRGNFEKAKKLIITFSGGESNEDSSIIYKPEDCYESVVALERALLKEGRYEEAKEVYYIYLDKIKGIEYEEYYKGKVVGPLERYNLNKKNVNN